MKQFIQREFLILSIWLKLVLRDRKKYLMVASSTYFLGFSGICRAAKPAYFFCRIIDDCVDGDLETKTLGYSSTSQLFERLHFVLVNQKHANNALEFLLLDLLAKVPAKCQVNLINFLEAMTLEGERREGKKIHTEKELQELHFKSFIPVIEMAFISLKTEYTSELLRDLSTTQSLVYSIQDLDLDIKKGICNIPQELMTQMGFSEKEFPSNSSHFWQNVDFLLWVKTCLIDAKYIGTKMLETDYAPKTNKLVSMLVKPIIEDIDNILKSVNDKKEKAEIAFLSN